MNEEYNHLLRIIEDENNNFISSKKLTNSVKCQKFMRKIIKKRSKLEEIYNLEKVLYNIRNSNKLNKYLSLYNETKVFIYLQKFILYRNALSKKYGYIDYNDIIQKKLKFDNQNIDDLLGITFNGENYTCTNNVNNKKEPNLLIDEHDFLGIIKSIDLRLYEYYKTIEAHLITNCDLDGLSALCLYMPISEKIYICTSFSNMCSNYDCLIHEIGHALDKKILLNRVGQEKSILIESLSDEIISSSLELLFIKSLQNFDKLKYKDIYDFLYTNFVEQTKFLLCKLKLEFYLNSLNQNVTEKLINEYWSSLIKKYLPEKKHLINKFSEKYTQTIDSFLPLKYYIGKINALIKLNTHQLNYKNILNNCGESLLLN